MKPFKNVSMTGTGIAISLIMEVLNYFNITVASGQVSVMVNGVVAVVAFIMVVYGQLRRKDLVWGLKRK